jgi:N-acylglucosamine 2-epimerase
MAARPDPEIEPVLDDCLDKIMKVHVRRDEKVLYETLAAGTGKPLNTGEGRTLNPGHAIECMWFVMHEAVRRGDEKLWREAAEVAEWMMGRGWDYEYGGLFGLVDIKGGEPQGAEWFKAAGLNWDAKVWWAHSEALYATLLGYNLTRRPALLEWFEKAHAYTFGHFADKEYPEWYSYLDRRGKPTDDSKGNAWKGFFHVPRALLYCYLTLRQMKSV